MILRSYKQHKTILLFGVATGFLVHLCQINLNKCHDETNFKQSILSHHIRDLRSKQINDELNMTMEKSKEAVLNDLDKKSKANIQNEIDGKTGVKYSKLIRPRFYSSELGIREKLLVSIVSNEETIYTRAIAINQTLTDFVNKIIFFIDGVGTKQFNVNLPIVGFKYSNPDLFLFRVLSYLIENYINDYDYYMIVMDSTYINGYKLMSFLQKLSVSYDIHIGKLIPEAKFCSIENGVIVSNSILEILKKNLLMCSRNLPYSQQQNLGECIIRTTAVPCKSQFQNLFYSSFELNSEDYLNEQLFLNNDTPITVNGISDSASIYKLHIYAMQALVKKNLEDIANYQSRIDFEKESLEKQYRKWPTGSGIPPTPSSRHDVLKWTYFNNSEVFMPNDLYVKDDMKPIYKLDIMRVVNSSIRHLSHKYSLSYELLSYDGYHRFDPSRGMDYLLNIRLKSFKQEKNFKIEGSRGLAFSEIVYMPYVTENKEIHILIETKVTDVDTAISFIERLEAGIVKQITLIFIINDLTPSTENIYQPLKASISKFSEKFYSNNSQARWVESSLSVSIKKLPSESLVLLVSPMARINSEFFSRVRLNTILGWQIFSPIPFSLYHSLITGNKKEEVKSGNGMFDHLHTDTIAFYVSDYKAADKSKDGKKEKSVYSKFIAGSNLHMLRAVEPDFIIPFSNLICSQGDIECYNKQTHSFGSKTRLSEFLHQKHILDF